MLNYEKEVIEVKPRLVISYDSDIESPREWDNLGYFITCENGSSPDNEEDLKDLIQSTGDDSSNLKEHIENIKKGMPLIGYTKVLEVYPVSKYEHGGIVYSLGEKHGFDYSNCGFYIVTEKTQGMLGIKKENFEKVIKQEISTYNSWVNGDIYQYYLYDDKGEFEDSCGGFFDIEGIREHLPKEFKKENLEDYLVN